MINMLRDENDREWMRRRQMRLVQVRKQSNDIAKQLRTRANNEERERKIQKANEVEMKLELWKMQRLKDLNEMFRDGVSNIGTAHKLAVQDLENNEISEEKKKELMCKAKERGESAMEHILREKREAVKKKLIPIQRRLITRQIEDIRSSLVRSMPIQKPNHSRKISKKPFNPKLFESNCEGDRPNRRKILYQEHCSEKIKKKPALDNTEEHGKSVRYDSGKRKLRKTTKRRSDSPYKTETKSDTINDNLSNMNSPGGKKIWINLGAVEAVTQVEGDDEKIKMVISDNQEEKKESREKIVNIASNKNVTLEKKSEQNVECHSYSVRHKCNMKSSLPSVRRVDKQTEPDPFELARQEEEQLEEEKKEKERKMQATAERGLKAIEKEKVTRDYNELLAKLEKLSTREKIIKTYCHLPPPDMFMSDERRQEKSKRKQRIMDSKFEKIYYETMGINPSVSLGRDEKCNLGKECSDGKTVSETEDDAPAKIDFCGSEWNLNANSQSSITRGSTEREKNQTNPIESVTVDKTKSSLHFERTKIKGEIALSDIDKLLEKTRQLREESYCSGERSSSMSTLISSLGYMNQDKMEEKETVPSELDIPPNRGHFSELGKSIMLSPFEGENILQLSKKEENMKWNDFEKGTVLDLGMGDLGRCLPGIRTETIAWPVMTNVNGPDEICRSGGTSYKALPFQFLPKRINSLLKLLVKLKEREGKDLVADELIVKMEKTLDALIREAERNKDTLNREECREFQFNPKLNYYISKLLMMSRETVSTLNVTSESEISILRAGESDNSGGPAAPNASPDNRYNKQINQCTRTANLRRARELEMAVLKWKRILEDSLQRSYTGGESCEDSSLRPEYEDDDDYDEDESDSFFNNCNDEEDFEEDVCFQGGLTFTVEPKTERPGKSTMDRHSFIDTEQAMTSAQNCPPTQKEAEAAQVCEGNTSHNISYREKEEGCAEGSLSKQSGGEYMDSIPDVMNVLLEKGILTSPFHWGSPEKEESEPEDSCLFCRQDRIKLTNEMITFRCRRSCKGACNRYYVPHLHKETAEMRKIRKKLEKLPMKYLDQRFGLYSPVDLSPRPFPTTPEEDESFRKRNFGKPLFDCSPKPVNPEFLKPRQLYFKIERKDRPSSEPKSEFPGLESEPAQPCFPSPLKRPLSSPISGLEIDTSEEPCTNYPFGRNITFEDSSEYVSTPESQKKPVPGLDQIVGLTKYFMDIINPPASQPDNCAYKPQDPPPAGHLDEKYFRPYEGTPLTTAWARDRQKLNKKPRARVKSGTFGNEKCIQSPELAPPYSGMTTAAGKYISPIENAPPVGSDRCYRPTESVPTRSSGVGAGATNENCFQPTESVPTRGGLDEKYFRPCEESFILGAPVPTVRPRSSGVGAGATNENCFQPTESAPPRSVLDDKFFRPCEEPFRHSAPGPSFASEKYFRPAESVPRRGTLEEKCFRACEEIYSGGGAGVGSANEKYLRPTESAPTRVGLDEKYFRPATPGPELQTEQDPCRSIPRGRDDSIQNSYGDLMEGIRSNRMNWNKGSRLSCAGACALHCNLITQQGGHHPSGNERNRGGGPEMYVASSTNILAYAESQFANGRRPKAASSYHQQRTTAEDDCCGTGAEELLECPDDRQ